MEETPRSKTTAVNLSVARLVYRRAQIGELALEEDEPAARCAREVSAAGECARVAIDTDDPTLRGFQNFAAVAPGAEGRVDIDPAIAHIEELYRGADEHGNVTSQSASDSALAVAARHHSRAPCGSSAATREPSCLLSARTFSVASASSARKRPGSQI